MIRASRDAGVEYFTEYLFQLMYLNELHGECNGTAHACVNSGYQALFSPITEYLGTTILLQVCVLVRMHTDLWYLLACLLTGCHPR